MNSRSTLAVAAAFLLLTVGCRVQSNENSSNGTKNVRVETPLGGLHVRSGDTTAADLGLPVYPGATATRDTSDAQSANVHIGFEDWQLRVKEASYHTPDSQEQVLAFYQKALRRFGDVIRCRGGQPVGAPTVTDEGLTCSGTNEAKLHVHANMQFDQGLTLKSGSPHHQHVMGIDTTHSGSGTSFSLIEIELPDGGTGD